MKQLIFILLSCFVLISCKKNVTIAVTTINKVTGQPVPNVTIFATEALSWDPIHKAKGAFFEGKTNQDGKLIINFKMRNNGKYTLIQQIDDGGSCWHNNKSVSLENGKNSNITFEFAPCAQLKLKIENVNCMGDEDEIYYQRHWLSGGESTNGVTQFGCFVFDGSYFNVPMGAYKYTWRVTKNGVTDSYEEEFIIPEAGQYELEIFY